jgi:hypothetical protein
MDDGRKPARITRTASTSLRLRRGIDDMAELAHALEVAL